MFDDHSQILAKLCHEQGLVSPAALAELDAESHATGKPLARLLIELALVERETLLKHIAAHLGCECLSASEIPVDLPAAVLATVPATLSRVYGVLPMRSDAQSVDLLAVDPFNAQIVDDLTFALGKDIRIVVADPDRVAGLIQRHYGEDNEDLDTVLAQMAPEHRGRDEKTLSDTDLETMAGQTPIVRFVNLVLRQAVRDHASDIHFEPFEHEFKIRYRIDGALYEMAPPPQSLALPIASRIKVLANLNIAERRIPQDGRIKLTIAGRAVDLRVSTLPTQFGESVVLRILDQSTVRLDLAELGMPAEVLKGVREIVRRPNGIFVVTGPTGSGKTTTLYSALHEINTTDLKLLTAEDPVEYEIEGIMQTPINPSAGLSFATALRSFLRQDPDVIMVGEIRDLETAQVAIQASLTGHLVLSTLHTNDAPGAVTRLIDMGVEPFLVATSLEAVLAQRLVRRICLHCRVAYAPEEGLLRQMEIDPAEVGEKSFFYGRGCEACSQTGYRGRLGIYEWLRLTDAVRDLIVTSASTLAIRRKAREQGMQTLRADGLRAMLEGVTSADEVAKYI